MTLEKIKSIDNLKEILKIHKGDGKKIVHSHGCFDLIHPGHLDHFEDAKKQGDILVVTVTRDKYIEKGPGRPFFDQDIRLRVLSSLECIDYVALNNWDTAVKTLELLKPDVYVKGKEVLNNNKIDNKVDLEGRVSNLDLEKSVVEGYGGELYLTDMPTFSSSEIINSLTNAISDEARPLLKDIKDSIGGGGLVETLDSLKDIKVLVMGDAILDEYIFCTQMDKAGKSEIVATKYDHSEIYLGGSFAIANHLAGFVSDVELITVIGEDNQDLLDNEMKPNVSKNFFTQKNHKTIKKTRYIDNYRGDKKFEIYNFDSLKTSKTEESKIKDYLSENISKFDLVIVSDFGHGMMSQELSDFVLNTDSYLAINSQLNAGNMGYNFITKYNRADFVSLNEKEIRLPMQMRSEPIEVPIKELSKRLNGAGINTTRGSKGSIYYDGNIFHKFPAFNQKPIDTVGAGDAVFLLTSLLSYKGVEPKLIPFFGNCIGSISTEIMGNSRFIDASEVKKFASYVIK